MASERPAFTDYCSRLEHDIQGRKHGFLAGNVTLVDFTRVGGH